MLQLRMPLCPAPRASTREQRIQKRGVLRACFWLWNVAAYEMIGVACVDQAVMRSSSRSHASQSDQSALCRYSCAQPPAYPTRRTPLPPSPRPGNLHVARLATSLPKRSRPGGEQGVGARPTARICCSHPLHLFDHSIERLVGLSYPSFSTRDVLVTSSTPPASSQ